MQDDGMEREQAPGSGPEADPPTQFDEADEADEADEWMEGDPEEEAEWLEEPSRQRVGLPVLAGTFALGVVTSLLVALAWGFFTGDDAGQGSTTATRLAAQTEPLDTGSSDDATSGAGDPAVHDHPVATRLSRCATASRNLGGPLEAAAPALDQWAVHVGAMNKLVVGEITLQQASQFWNRTRVGAQNHIDAFRDAVRTLRGLGVDCPSTVLLAPGARALPGCARQVEAEARVLRAATTAINTWDQHVQHMDMLRLGELSPEDATRMWLSMWEQGVRDLDAYRAADGESRLLDGCSVIGSAR